MKRSLTLNGILLLLGAVLFFVTIRNISFESLKTVDVHVNANVLILIVVILLFFFVRAVRWTLLLKAAGIHIPFSRVYTINTVSLAFSQYSPAQAGDVLKLQLIKKSHGVQRRESLSAVLFEKGQDLGVAILGFGVTLIYFDLFQISDPLLLSVLLIGGLAASAAILYVLVKRMQLARDILQTALKSLTKPLYLAASFGMTLCAWSLLTAMWLLVADILGINAHWWIMFGIVCGTSLVMVITLIPGAVGSMELSNTFLAVELLGISYELAVFFALAIRLLTVLIFVMGYVHLLSSMRIKSS